VSQPPEYSEEELRALEAEMEKITVDDVILQTIVSLLNLSARKAGLGNPPGEGPPPDWAQVRTGIDAARGLLALVEPRHAEQLGPVRDGLSRLQMIYVQQSGAESGAAAEGAAPTPPPPAPGPQPPQPPGPAPGQPGEAQRTGRLWVPGQ